MNSEKPIQAPIIVPSSDVGRLVETVAFSGSEELEGKGGGMERDGEGKRWRGERGTKKSVNKLNSFIDHSHNSTH